MKRFNTIVITVILVVVLLAVEVIIVKSASKYEPQVDIVFADEKIPEGAVIEADMLAEKKVDINLVHRQSIRNIEYAVGKTAKMDIEKGEMVLGAKLGKGGRMHEIEVKDKNSRLFSIEFKGDQANGWWLEAGQYVDIIFVPSKDEHYMESAKEAGLTSRKGLTQTHGINVQRLRNIRIAALIDDKGRIVKNSDRNLLPRYVSFEVNEEQDEFLAYAKSNGRLEISVVPKKQGGN